MEVASTDFTTGKVDCPKCGNSLDLSRDPRPRVEWVGSPDRPIGAGVTCGPCGVETMLNFTDRHN